MENSINQETETKNLNLDNAGISHLKETRIWTNFLSILGFVFLGLGALAAFLVPTFGGLNDTPYGGMSTAFLFFFMAIFIVLYFFPIYYLFMFSKLAKQAVDLSDSTSFSEAMRYLKKHYRYMGILMIIVLGFYVLVLIISLMAGSLFSVFNT